MNDDPTPRRVLIGTFPSGVDAFAFEAIGKPLVDEAVRQLDEARAKEERAARAVIQVDKAWLLSVMCDLTALCERDLARAIDAGDYTRRCTIARKINRLREEEAEVMQHREPPL